MPDIALLSELIMNGASTARAILIAAGVASKSPL
jgi:hypothetical protein